MVIQTSLMSSVLFTFLNLLLEFIPSPLGYFPNDQSYRSLHPFMNVNMFFFPFVGNGLKFFCFGIGVPHSYFVLAHECDQL